MISNWPWARSEKPGLGCHHYQFARVSHHFIWLVLRRYADAVVLADKHDLKAALGEHSRKGSFALSDRQCLLRVIPVKGNRGVHSLFIVVAVVPVFVEREISIRAAIDAQLDGVFGFLRGSLLFRPHRTTRTRVRKHHKLTDK